MLASSQKSLLAIVALCGISACSNGEESDGTAQLESKSDVSGVASRDVNQKLRSRTIRREICKQSTEGFLQLQNDTYLDGCLEDGNMRVRQELKSTTYAYLRSGNPIVVELGMTFAYEEHPSYNEGSELLCTAKRQWNDENYAFSWSTTCTRALGNNDTLLNKIGGEVSSGQYLEDALPDIAADESVNLTFEYLNLATLPQNIAEVAQDYAEGVDFGPQSTDSAYVEEDAIHAVFYVDGQVIGYMVMVGYSIDGSLFDGGGVVLILNVEGKIISDEEWFG